MLALESAAALAAGGAVAVAAAIWWLASGPLSLDRFTPWLDQALSLPDQGVAVTIEHAELRLDTANRTLDIVAAGMRVNRKDGSAEVALPRVAFDLSLRAALAGDLAPTRIELFAPQMRLERAPDGTIHLGLGEGGGAEHVTQDLLGALAAAPTRQGPLGYLQEVAIRDAVLTLDDRALGVTWRADHVDATVFRGEAGAAGDAQVAIIAGGQETDLHGEFRYVAADRRLAGEISVAGLEPARFAAAAPSLAPLGALRVPVAGRVSFSLDTTTLRVGGGRADLTLGPGSIDRPELATGSLAIAGGAAKLAYDPVAARLTVETLSLDLGGRAFDKGSGEAPEQLSKGGSPGGPEIVLSGEVGGLAPEFLRGAAPSRLDVTGSLILRRVPVDAFPRYWPDWLSPGSRTWVTTHIHDGTVDETKADVRLTADLSPGAAKPVQVESLQGTIAYRNLTVDYFPPLPPVRGVDGAGRFDRARFDLMPTSGALAGLRMTGGTVAMTKLDTNDETIAIDVAVQGPLRDALEVIDNKPLQYARAVGIEPAKVGGRAEMQLSFGFPLLNSLRIEDMQVGVKAKLQDVAAAGLALGHDLTDGDLQLDLDRATLRVGGTASIDAVPATLSWTQSLKSADRRYMLKARLDDDARRRLGVDYLSDVIAVSGPVDVDLDYNLQSQAAAASLSLDLRDAVIAVDKLDWTKQPGAPATARLTLAFTGDRLTSVPAAVIAGAGIDAALSAAFSPQTGELERLDVKRLAVGNTDLAGSLVRQARGGWAVTLAGKSLDASHLVSNLNKGAGGERETPVTVNLHLDRVVLGPGREAQAVKLRFVDDGQHWQTVVADAALTGGGTLTVRFGEHPGERDLKIMSDNLGAVLKLIDASDNVVGGKILVTGQAEDRAGHRIFGGHAEGEDYSIVRAPLFARLLSVASLSGIGALLSGEGVPFTHLRGNFSYEEGRLALSEARAYGGAIGINLGGTVDFHANTLDLAGTLVPANVLNNVLGNIPLLGPLVQGGEGHGMFAANFRIAGSLDDPKISTNPLSVLAPGFVRRLFLFEAPNPNPAPAAEGAPDAKPQTGK